MLSYSMECEQLNLRLLFLACTVMIAHQRQRQHPSLTTPPQLQKITSIITTHNWAWIYIRVTISCLESVDRAIETPNREYKREKKGIQNKKYQVFSWNARLLKTFIYVHETSSFAHKYSEIIHTRTVCM